MDEPEAPDRPFATVEGAREYVALLADEIVDTEASVQKDIAQALAEGATRRAEALRIVALKLEQLRGHVTSSARILNDLRSLRRLLLDERDEE